MQKNVHPKSRTVEIKCGCGKSGTVFMVYDKPTLEVEVCSHCHPFYTGKHKIFESAGQVEKFRGRYKGL